MRRGATRSDKDYRPPRDFWGNEQADNIFLEPKRYKEQVRINFEIGGRGWLNVETLFGSSLKYLALFLGNNRCNYLHDSV